MGHRSVVPPEICPKRTVLNTRHRTRSVPAASVHCGGRGAPAAAPAPTQAVRRAEVHARRPRQQPPGVLLGKAPFLAEERPFLLAEKYRIFHPGKSEAPRSRAQVPKQTPRSETRFHFLPRRSTAPPSCVPQQRAAMTNENTGASSGQKQMPGSRRGRDRHSGSRQPGTMSSWAAFKAPPQMSLPPRGHRGGCGQNGSFTQEAPAAPPPALRRALHTVPGTKACMLRGRGQGEREGQRQGTRGGGTRPFRF